MIDRLLDWGRMEKPRRQYHMQPTDVHAIVKQAMRDFEGLRERQSVQFALESPDHLPPVSAGERLVSDALLNLLTNAIKYGGHPAYRAPCNGHAAPRAHRRAGQRARHRGPRAKTHLSEILSRRRSAFA